MNFSILRRLDFQDFSFNYLPVALCGNGGVLLQTSGGVPVVKRFGGVEEILFGGVPRFYIYPANGTVIALDQPAQPEATLIALSDSNVALSSSPLGVYHSNGTFSALPLEASMGPRVVGMNSRGQIIGCYAGSGASVSPWLLDPSPLGISRFPSTENYAVVSLAEAGAMAGLAPGFTPIAINDVGWVLLAGASGPGVIVDMSNAASPRVLYPQVKLGALGLGVAMSTNGWIATQNDRAAATISVYYLAGGVAYAVQIGHPGASLLSVGNINSDGQLVGTVIPYTADNVNAGRPFYWDDANGAQSLNVEGLPPGDMIVGAVGINDAGQIAAMAVGGETDENYGLLLAPA